MGGPVVAWQYVSAMGFGGSILGSAYEIWGNPYLNSNTVLSDKEIKLFSMCSFRMSEALKAKIHALALNHHLYVLSFIVYKMTNQQTNK